MSQFHVGGFLVSPPSPKDRDFSLLVPRLSPASGDVDLEPLCTEVSDQMTSNSCVANASGDGLELMNALDGLEVEDVSRLQIYFNGRSVMSMDGIVNESTRDQGMYIRAAFKAMNVFGVCPEKDWPFDLSKVNTRPTVVATFRALKNKIHSYYKLASTGEDLLADFQTAIRGRKAVVFGIPVTDAFMSSDGSEIPAPRAGEKVHGLHAILAMGTIGDSIKIRNSWGRRWGRGGYGVLSPEWFTKGHIHDPWVLTGGKNLL
jgi:hypothetical protein